ncbi:hypothetical protein B0H63DRAFT_472939 [Podospora didyma]|uniref:Uncharacterized protein n=1 Tax=Podospora didyma TaxID=330526 RepID=A0AAE0NQ38_9PEZI|nr:hypothetical protein B0H63DRAFT_472939 [Podospora didyma]
MSDELDLPLALRRSRRSSLGPQRQQMQRDAKDQLPPTPKSSAASTPNKNSRPKKRVRFSDPGPILGETDDELSTGLTPFIRRTALSARPSRRHSTPSRLLNLTASGSGALDLDNPSSPLSGEVRFLPLRQVLDGRVKRRIRRNGLSEEMNTIYAERKQRARDTKAEIERLKAEVAAKDDEIHRLHDETIEIDTDRVWELERQVETLKKELTSRSGVQEIPSSPAFEWTMAARDPFSDDFMDVDTGLDVSSHEFGSTTMAELTCGTPTRKGRAVLATPPTTSPAKAAAISSPCPPTILLPPVAHTGVQTSLPDLEKQELEVELDSLQLEICKLTSTLESYSSLTAKLSEKLAPFSPLATSTSTDEPSQDIEARFGTVLQTLSDRTAALLELNNSLSGLGFPGADAFEIITSLSSTFRSARLELEYLTPGEVTLPLNSAGAEVLDLILARLRDLAKKNREADDTIDEYHSIEQSLRQQLGARVSAMDTLGKQVNQLETEALAKDTRITELEVGLERLKGAVRTYARDVAELEGLVNRIEGELETSTAERTQDQITHADTLTEKTSLISELETKLAAAVAQTDALQSQLAALQSSHSSAVADLQTGHKTALAKINKSHGQALALRDARVAELRLEIDRINASLRTAHETVKTLRVENAQLTNLNEQLASENSELAARMEVDRRKAKGVIDAMRAELERVARMSDGLLGTPKKKEKKGSLRRDSGFVGGGEEEDGASGGTPSGGLLSGELAKKSEGGKSRKRRRYDSGLGFLDEEEVDCA